MAKGISIGVAGDTREFTSAVKKGVIEPLEDADDAIKKLGRDGNLDDIERDMTDAQRATSKYEDELRDVIDQQKKAGRGARDMGDDAEHSLKGAGKVTGEFKDEALANFSEVTSSFDGSMSSVLDLAQGTFGGLASLGGPIGIAAGGIAAILGGVFTSMTASAEAQSEKSKQAISDMFDDMIESGNRFASEDLINSAIKEIIKDSDQLEAVKERAKNAGISIQTALRAEAGDKDALATALAGANAESERLIANGDKSASSVGHAVNDRVIKYYSDLANNVGTAASKADLYTQAASKTAEANAKLGNSASTAGGKVDSLGSKLNELPSSKDISLKVNVDDAVAREHLRELGKAVNVDMFVTPKTGRGIN